MTAVAFRYSLLAVVGAGAFAAAPVATVLALGAITEDHHLVQPVAPAPLAAADIDAFLAREQRHLHPAFVHGAFVGIELFSVRADGALSRAGLRNGDVIIGVNGVELQTPERALEAYQRAQRDRRVVVDFLRRGQRGTLTHSLD